MAAAQNRPYEKEASDLKSLRYGLVTTPQFWVGRHQEIRQELQEDRCRGQNITYGRRITGGDVMCLQEGDFFCEFHCEKRAPSLSAWLQARLRVLESSWQLVWGDWNAAGILYRQGKEVGRLGWTEEGGWTVQLLFYGRTPDAASWQQYLRLPREKRLAREMAVWQQHLGCLWPDLEAPKREALLCRGLAAAFAVRPEKALPKITAAPFLRFGDEAGERASLRQGQEWLAVSVRWEQGRLGRVRLRGNASWDGVGQGACLEQALRGLPGEKAAAFLEASTAAKRSWGGISAAQLAGLVRSSAAQDAWRRRLGGRWVAADFRWVGISAAWQAEQALQALGQETPTLLLPYCAKPAGCSWRRRDGCGGCGGCGLGRLWTLAKSWGWQVKTIQNYEQLEAAVASLRESGASLFLGICCPLFTEKHHLDFGRLQLPGLLLMLDHSACYEQGCEAEAHLGDYEVQAELDDRLQIALLQTLRRLQAEGDKDDGEAYVV